MNTRNAHGVVESVARNGQMMYDHYYERALAAVKRRDERIRRITDRASAEEYVREVKVKLADCFGSFPERTPLNPRVTGELKTDKLLIDKVLFESRPGLWVTGLFYRLRDVSDKRPGVLMVCGHSDEAKAYDGYQKVPQSLALRGYAVLIIDPIGQGERKQFFEGSEATLGCTTEHGLLGEHMLLTGDFLGRWRVWDAIRGLDYLVSRPEVDSDHLGVTGCSGGGTLTCYLSAFDPRPTMIAPSCYVSRLIRNIDNELLADSEQTPPRFLSNELDIADYLIAAAPRPTLILAQDNDFNDKRGVFEIHEEASRIYSLLGAKENMNLYMGVGGHCYSDAHRSRAGLFFNKITGLDTNWEESPDIKLFEPRELKCVPEGQVNLAGSRSVLAMLREERPVPKPHHPARATAELAKIVQKILRLGELREPDYSCLRPFLLSQKPLRYFSRFGIRSEPGVMAILKMLADQQCFQLNPKEDITLLVPDLDSVGESFELDFGNAGVREYLTLDTRMTGENRPNEIFPGVEINFDDTQVEQCYNGQGVMLDRPNLGGQVRDVIMAALVLRGVGARTIHMIGRGRGASHAALAALFIPEVTRLTLHAPPPSWRDMYMADRHPWHATTTMAFGVLNHLDVPEIHEALIRRGVELSIHDS